MWCAAEIIEGAKYAFYGEAVFPGKINIYPTFTSDAYFKKKDHISVFLVITKSQKVRIA
jgi:hypothetical protein